MPLSHLVPRFFAHLAGVLTLSVLPLAHAGAQAGALVPQAALPGDAASVPAVSGQSDVSIARGGPGYLAVWTDYRTSLSGSITTDQPLQGNQSDIYAMRLGLDGHPLDAGPIVICNLGRNQSKPRVAWNGQNWLVVFISERPDWYFFDDIVGVRVAPDGSVLDATPISIRPELNSPSNYYGVNPSVSSDGAQWIVVWEDWIPANGHSAVKGTRVGNDGSVLDPGWPVLFDNGSGPFGPIDPQVVPVNGALLLAWREPVFNRIRARRLDNGLSPLGADFLVATTPTQFRPSLVSDGSQSYLLADSKVFRISAAGTVLDPAGISIPAAGLSVPQAATAAWNGAALAIVRSGTPAPVFGSDSDLFLVRMAPNGSLIDPAPVAITNHPDNEFLPAVAGEAGRTQIAYLALGKNLEHLEDIRGVSVDATLAATAPVEIGAGLARQEHVRAISAPFGSLLTFTSRSSATSRAVAQRLDASGNALDQEPVQIAATEGTKNLFIGSACNGSMFCFTWGDQQGPIFARRYSLDLQPLDAAPVQVFANGGAPGVGALPDGGDFLIASNYLVSNDQSYIHARRLRAGDGVLLDAAFDVTGNYAFDPKIESLGGRWLLCWSSKPSHDSPATLIRARFVEANGTLPTPSFLVSTIAFGMEHDLAVNGDRALIVWQDDGLPTDAIEGRLLRADGSFVGPDFIIDDELGDQAFPTVTASGAGFITAWVDFRAVPPNEQLRGDLWAARVTADGAVLDPSGVQLTSGPLPEDLPDASSSGFSFLFFDALGGGGAVPDVPRIASLRLDDAFPGAWTDVGPGLAGTNGVPGLFGSGALLAGSSNQVVLTGAKALAPALLFVSFSSTSAPFKGGSLVAFPPELQLGFVTNAVGGVALPFTWPSGVPAGTSLYFQMLVQDVAAPQAVALSNALHALSP